MKVQWAVLKDKVKASVNLKELVEEYTSLTAIGYNVWSGHCPHPDHEDKTPSFRVFRNRNGSWSFKCFGCQDIHEKKGQNGNYGSDCFAFLQWMSDYKGSKKVLTFTESLLMLAEREGISVIASNGESEILLRQLEYKCKLAQSNLLPNVKRYLFDRGLNEDDIKKWQIGSWLYRENNQGVFRITFPLFNRKTQVIGFSSRILKEQEGIPKYVNSKNSLVFQKRNYLYGQHLLDISCHDIRITEGQFDVILATKYGLKNTVATLGTSFTDDHALWIKKHNLIPTFIYDSDNAGIKAAERAFDICQKQGISSNICILPDGYDLADFAVLKKESLSSWISDHTVPSWLYKLRDVAIRYEANLQALRNAILPDIRRVIPTNQEDKILMSTFVKERFGIIL